jgi:transglutaminase-like putative cysteine protease
MAVTRADEAGPGDPEPLRWLRVQHDTRYEYDAPVELAHHLAHLYPRETAHQVVRDIRLDVSPAPEGEVLHDSLDAFGNHRTVFTHAQVHEHLLVRAGFLAGLRKPPALDVARSPAWESVVERLRYRAGKGLEEAEEFVLPSIYVPRDPALAAYGRRVCTPGRPLLELALALMARIHEEFEYQPSSTSVATRASDALVLRAGVCQDFAHVMIGALRGLGLAARYVSGYLLTQPPPGQPRLVGADASHAWVAVWCPVLGWVALDPTNSVPAALDHVTLAWGRDYADVAPLRGVIRGGGKAEPQVAVTVEEVLPA